MKLIPERCPHVIKTTQCSTNPNAPSVRYRPADRPCLLQRPESRGEHCSSHDGRGDDALDDAAGLRHAPKRGRFATPDRGETGHDHRPAGVLRRVPPPVALVLSREATMKITIEYCTI